MGRPPRDRDLLSSSEAARLLDVDRRTVLRWTTAGRLPTTVTPGGNRHYRRGDVEALRGELGVQPGQVEQLLCPQEAVMATGLSYGQLRTHWRAGRLPFSRTAGGQRRFRRGDLDALGH